MSPGRAPSMATMGGIQSPTWRRGKELMWLPIKVTVSMSSIKIVTQYLCLQEHLLPIETTFNCAKKESWHQYSISLHLSVARRSSWRMPGSYIECPALGTKTKNTSIGMSGSITYFTYFNEPKTVKIHHSNILFLSPLVKEMFPPTFHNPTTWSRVANMGS